ncbi:MAG TPA: alcohol dehydrogenase catalytic domain-containing protein [Polyangiaceae bacterium]|nr:alcohol dehydrogenase catalytic domain-containing protein [Polyangiaceae bacterium]
MRAGARAGDVAGAARAGEAGAPAARGGDVGAGARPEMLALVRGAGGPALRVLPAPGRPGPGEVLVRVAFAGVCRTDVYAAEGRIPVASGRVLGHEFAGRVVALGEGVRGPEVGCAVTADPRLPCGGCAGCRAGGGCARPRFLGLDVDGAFCEWLLLPARSLVPLPEGLDLRVGAYVEPVAATLAVLGAGIAPGERGVVYGAGRIAALAYDVLRAHGFERVELCDPGAALDEGAYDFAVEAGLTGAGLRALVAALRPRGRLVLKSRLVEPLPLELGPLVRKELSLVAAHYGSFDEAVGLLARGRLELGDRLAPPRPLAEFAPVFAGEARAARHKAMFALGPEGGL